MGYGDQRNSTGGAPPDGDAPSFIWRFGDAELDEACWRLSVRGQPVELEPRPLQVLRELLRCAGEVVRKDELVEAVYGHQHVTDGALNQAISKLRSALGDRDQAIITTVHRLGYRLAVPVQVRAAFNSQAQPVTLQTGGTLPGRDQWELIAPLGANRGIEVWLARHRKLGEQRVFKVSVDGARLSCLKREVTLYRMLSQQLGERDDFVKVLDWNFDQAPFYIECEYGGVDLLQWWQAQNEAAGVPLEQRLERLARQGAHVECRGGLGGNDVGRPPAAQVHRRDPVAQHGVERGVRGQRLGGIATLPRRPSLRDGASAARTRTVAFPQRPVLRYERIRRQRIQAPQTCQGRVFKQLGQGARCR